VTRLTSCTGAVEFGPGRPTLLINGQLNIIGQDPCVLQELREGRFDSMMRLARAGVEKGVRTVDILLDHPELDEAALLPSLVRRLHEELDVFISLDSRNPAALDAVLSAIRPAKGLVNSVTAEKALLELLLPIVRKYGAAVVGIPIGEAHGLPHTVEGRLAEARVILDAAQAAGIPREDVVLDGICLSAAVEPGSFQVALETLRGLRQECEVSTILGISNAGYGLPEPTIVEQAYLLAAIPWGLDAALIDPATPGLVESVLAMDYMVGNDPSGKRYLNYYRAKKKGNHG
jgi:5-methyltetrahydrofolate--homocysteine methyltransferase